MLRLTLLLVVASGCGRLAFEPEGLLAAYPMDDLGPTDDHLADRHGGHDGVCTSPKCPTIVAGKLGDALQFDGTDNITIAASPDFEMTAGFTIAVWVYLDSRPSTLAHIMAKPYGSGDFDTWALAIRSAGTVVFFDDNTVPHGLDESTVLSLATWHHVAARWDGVRQQILVDGFVVVGEEWPGPVWDGSAVHIGTDIVGGVAMDGFTGRLDELQLYNRALTDAEIDDVIVE